MSTFSPETVNVRAVVNHLVRSVLALLLVGVVLAPAYAQIALFNASFGNTIATSMPASIVAPGLTVSPVIRGSGLVGAVGSDNGFGSAGYPTGDTDLPDQSQNAYIGFTVTNDTPATQTVTITFMEFMGLSSTGGGPSTLAFEISRYGFTDDAAAPIFNFGSGFDIGFGSQVLNSSNPSIEFRLYGYNATSSTGVFSIGANATGYDALVVLGSITAASAPEPNSFMLISLCVVPASVIVRRLRRSGAGMIG